MRDSLISVRLRDFKLEFLSPGVDHRGDHAQWILGICVCVYVSNLASCPHQIISYEAFQNTKQVQGRDILTEVGKGWGLGYHPLVPSLAPSPTWTLPLLGSQGTSLESGATTINHA